MNTMNQTVAMNIKSLREKNKLSMEELSRISGVSKSMLAQIERGDGNPTISTLWKIANGMQVPFDALTLRPKQDFEIIRNADIQPILADNGRVRNYSIFPDDENRKFAVYYVEIEKGAYLDSEPHMKGTAEFVTIHAGQLTIRAGDDEYTVEKGESIRFKADVSHSYHNSGDEMVYAYMVLYNS